MLSNNKNPKKIQDLHFRKCAKNDYCVYSINNNNVIKHNMFTKKSYIVFHSNDTVTGYYISNKNVIVNTICAVYWNDRLITNNSYALYSRFLKTQTCEYITNCSYLQDELYDRYGCKISFETPYFVVSLDGTKILYSMYGSLHKQDITSIPTFGLFKRGYGATYINTRDCNRLRWIQNSTYAVIDHNIILNLEDFQEIHMITPYDNFFVFLVDELIIVWHFGFVEIYDTRRMTFVDRVNIDVMFTDYNQLLNALVTDERDCYRLKNNHGEYRFEHVNFGANYILDYNVVPQNIKVIIEIFCVLDAIPDEILCIELYWQLLLCFSY